MSEDGKRRSTPHAPRDRWPSALVGVKRECQYVLYGDPGVPDRLAPGPWLARSKIAPVCPVIQFDVYLVLHVCAKLSADCTLQRQRHGERCVHERRAGSEVRRGGPPPTQREVSCEVAVCVLYVGILFSAVGRGRAVGE